MGILVKKIAGQHILTSAEVEPFISVDWFNLNYWQAKEAVLASATGRAAAYFIQTALGEVVWRKYRRGGLPGKFIRQSYLWLGLKNTRAYKEFLLTQQLYELGLPVPQPLAARVVKTGLTYQADLITRKLPNSQTLADYLVAAFAAPQPDLAAISKQLNQVEATIRQFHAQGLNHTDLNPRNILVTNKLTAVEQAASDVSRGTSSTAQQTTSCWLIDFDSCSLGKPSAAVAKNNRQRLVRGLTKLLPKQNSLWQQHFL